MSSFVIVTLLATPSVALISSGFSELFYMVTPVYSLMNLPPVKMAISWRTAFRLSPKDGALTAHIFRLFLSLLRISPASISLSISSAMIRRGLCSL